MRIRDKAFIGFVLFMLFLEPFIFLEGQQNPIQIDANGLTQTLTAGGVVTRGQIVKINSAGQVVPVLTTDTSGAIGVAATSQTSAGNSVTVSIAGTLLVQIDSGGCVAGNIVSISSISGGSGHCASTAVGQQVGVAQSISSPGSNFWNVLISFAGSGGIPPNTPLPASSSGPGPVFNVKNYGAKGDAQQSPNGNGQAPGLTCTDCNFTSADVGKNVACANLGSTVAINTHTIASVVSSTSVTISPAAREGNGPCVITWGTPDDTAVASATTAFIAAMKSKSQGGNLGIMASAPVLYFPAAGYYLTAPINVISPSPQSGGKVLGDGLDLSKLYFTTGINTAVNSLLQISANQTNMLIEGLTLDGMQGAISDGSGYAMALSGSNHVLNNVQIQNFGNLGGLQLAGAFMRGTNVIVVGNQANNGIICQGCTGEFRNSGSSNNGNVSNLTISGVVGSTSGPGFTWYGGLIDECGTNTTGCTQIINSHDVWFIAARLFGTPTGHCISVDANSFVHWSGGLCGAFGVDNNVGGPTIAAGGGLQATDLRSISTGTGKCITNSGTFNDNGGNSCESAFAIASGTSTGTAAVLTVTTLGANANTNCAVGDSLLVEGAGIAGYNGYFKAGITAVTATTISYTTQGSNLGALGGGGDAHCRNLLTYSGTLPVALLNNPIPNTCYITGTFAATTTAAPMCAFKLGSATNINFIKAASTTTTACTVAPVVTVSDGTVSETLTITTAKSIWDSSVDASTGVGTTIFRPNGTITLSNTVGTCTTPPTNFSVSYNITPILSN